MSMNWDVGNESIAKDSLVQCDGKTERERFHIESWRRKWREKSSSSSI